jgi:thiamine-phosphate pyrophosphorylase
MTDPKLGDALLASIQRLPFGSGVVFRHYQLEQAERQRLFSRIRRLCVRRGHMLLLADEPRVARRWNADGVHGRLRGQAMIRTMPVHGLREIAESGRFRADLVFLSPLYVTTSHPGAQPLKPMRFAQLAKRAAPARVIALGGMTRAKAAMWRQPTVHGWAAIDAFKK